MRRSNGTRRGMVWGPGVVDVAFLLVLATVLVGGRFRLLNDPGTFWHARLGRDILASGRVPTVDALTFTREGSGWVDQSWLFDVGLALVVRAAGWSGAVLLSALLLAWLYAMVARGLIRDGRSPLVALLVAVLAAGVGSIHFLVRPHLFTLVLFWVFLRLCKAQHERGGWVVAWTLPLTALWANLHGGFLAGPVVVVVAAAGHAIAGRWDRDRLRNVLKFLAAGAGCVVAALINPYGVGLYRHVAGLLVSAKVTDLIQEYQPIPFGSGDARVVEWMILALIAVPTFARSRVSRYELVQSLAWLHVSLSSVRNAPLFALAVAPGLAALLDGFFQAPVEASAEEAATRRARLTAWSVWPGVIAAGLALGLAGGANFGAFDPTVWPVAALPDLNRLPTGAKLFHEQDWGGMVESECRPSRLAFIDDRFELYGRAGILRYVNALEGGPGWDEIRDEYGINLVWLRPERPLARRLSREPGWRALRKDGVSVLFEREGTTPETLAGAITSAQSGR